MANPYWPFFDLKVVTPRIELRVPTDDDLVELADLSAQGVHPPDFMPFNIPWSTAPSPDRERGVLQWGWRQRGSLTPEDWRLDFVVVHEGRIVGSQGVGARQFNVLKAVNSGSWLGLAHQGNGIGKEMRHAMLHVVFDGLGADLAYSAAFEDNAASIAVSRAVGYEDNGDEISVRGDGAGRHIRFRIDRQRWEERRRDDIEVVGLEPCLPILGIKPSGG
jgi:RimJ/RimL family protein N-acetyltransferase